MAWTKDVGGASGRLIMIHIDKGGNQAATKSFLDHLLQYHVPFDVLGQSFYPWWHGSLEDLKGNLAFVWNTYHKDVVVAETAYDWRTGEDFKGKPAPFPQTAGRAARFPGGTGPRSARGSGRQGSRHLLVGADGRRLHCEAGAVRRPA